MARYGARRVAVLRGRVVRVLGLTVAALGVVLAAAAGGYVMFQPSPTPPTATPPIEGSKPGLGGTSPSPPAGHSTSAASPSPSFDLEKSVVVHSVPNFRDLAGDGIPLDKGARMATGIVYRAGKLTALSQPDIEALSRAGLSQIYDLRTPYVAARSPDPEIEGAEYHLVNIYAVTRTPTPHPASVAAAEEYMRDLNRAFVTDSAQRERIADVLSAISRQDAPVLIHCSEGKDRTGWVSALLQLIAGADKTTVLEQYLMSNMERADEIEKSYERVKRASGTRAADIDRALKTVDESYLDAGLTAVADEYGSLDGYLRDGLRLSRGTVDALRTRLRVEPR